MGHHTHHTPSLGALLTELHPMQVTIKKVFSGVQEDNGEE